jgi:hypothetical protein
MKFQELGLLGKMDTFQRNRRFIYSDYLAMFADEEIPGNDRKMLSEDADKTRFPT